MDTFYIGLGDQVRDRVTGFSGIVTGRVEYTTGCRQYLVQPRCKDSDWVEAHWLDEDRLMVISRSGAAPSVETPGHDAQAPSK